MASPFSKPPVNSSASKSAASTFDEDLERAAAVFANSTSGPLTVPSPIAEPKRRVRNAKVEDDTRADSDTDSSFPTPPLPNYLASSNREDVDLLDKRSGWIFTAGILTTTIPDLISRVIPVSQSAAKVLTITDLGIQIIFLLILGVLAYQITKGYQYAVVLFVQVAMAYFIPLVIATLFGVLL